MSFYQYYAFKATGAALASVDDFANAAVGTVFEKNTGDVYVKSASGILDKAQRKVIGQDEMDLRFARLSADNTFSSHILVNPDVTYDIGSSAKKWRYVYANTFYGNATSANYADVAEKYVTDKEYPVGTVLEVGGDKEVTLYTGGPLAGVVSGQPAYMLNAESEGQYVALKGKVPVFCQGNVKKGQFCVALDEGKVIGVNKADLLENEKLNIVGVALEDSKDGMVMVKV
ncbi:MAG: hypothetical protein ACO3AG_00850 [Fluviibacter sp.]